jgi:uncharacterized protein (DUF305 family)
MGLNIAAFARTLTLPTLVFMCTGLHGRPAPSDAPFIARVDGAMARMMNGMSVRPVGDADKDFVEMMVPHHQGAIEMSEAELQYGHNPQLKRLAQEIIVTQQEEIAAMRVAVGEALPPSAPAPDQLPATQEP